MDAFLSEIWGINKLYIDSLTQLIFDNDESAILISCDDENYDRYISLKSFRKILQNANLKTNLYDVQIAQIGIINSIKNLKISRNEVILNLKKIHENGIITEKKLEKITTFIKSLELINDENIVKITQKNDVFHDNINILNDCYCDIKNITTNKNLLNLLENAYKNANEAQFFISVTGVINSGKSTMLNSLLGFKILGTSNIPETANLSILKFSNKPYARVKFWSKDELNELGFETSNDFVQDLDINIDELKNYTTAKEEISKHVKMVELGVDSSMLKDGICIVDTPGLDDTVVLREELTKKFMHESDFVIHLMNAAQSVTKKDIDFIKNFLTHGKTSSFIIVLTHIDLIEKNELNDVINYTKSSITKELKEDGKDLNLINSVKFFAINGVNSTGLEDIKNYFYTTLFGDNSEKSKIILNNYKKELNNITSHLKDEFEFEFSALSCDSLRLDKELENLSQKMQNIHDEINDINLILNDNLSKLDYSNLQAFSHLKNISTLLKDRVVSDIDYAQKNRKKIDFERIFMIANGGFNDLLLDLFREVKFAISKDMQDISNQISIKFSSFDESTISSFDIKSYIDKNFSKPDYTVLNSKLSNIIKDKNSNLQNDIQNLFDEFLSNLDIKNNILKLINSYTKDFISYLKDIIDLKQQELEAKIITIKENILNLDNTSKNSDKGILKLKQNLEILNAISKRINEC